MIRRLVSAAAIVAASVVALTGEATHGGLATAAAARIVAIGDIHGSFDNFVAILTKAGLIDANRRWTGGKTVFVHTGDTTDRGPGVKEALDLLMALEKQASSRSMALRTSKQPGTSIGEVPSSSSRKRSAEPLIE